MSSMSSSSSENESCDSEFVELGELAYQFEPEYTEEEIQSIASDKLKQQQEIDERLNSNSRKSDTSLCFCQNNKIMPLCLCYHEFELYDETLTHGQCIIGDEDFQTVF